MFITDNLRIVRAKWQYLRNERQAAEGAGTHTTGALENEIDLAQRLLQRLSWCELGELGFILFLVICLPLNWLPWLLAVGVSIVVLVSAKDTKKFAPFLPKLDAKVNPNPLNSLYIPRAAPDLSQCQALAAWPAAMRDALIAAIRTQHLEQAQELCAAYLAYKEAESAGAFTSSQAAHSTPVYALISTKAQHQTKLLPPEVQQAYFREHAMRALRLKLNGLNVGIVPDDCGRTLMYAGMPLPSSLLLQYLPEAKPEQDPPLFLGFGSRWTSEHQRRASILLRDGRTTTQDKATKGMNLMHKCLGSAGFKPIVLPSAPAGLHCLITGTTDSGKTSMLMMLASQSILQHRPTIVIDPKGDKTLKKALVAALESAGRDPLTELKCCDLACEPAPQRESRRYEELMACYYQESKPRHPKDLQHQAQELSRDEALMQLTNVGFNPLGDMGDDVHNMAECLCAELAQGGQAKSFTSASVSAMKCAIYCSLILTGKVTITTIGEYYDQFESIELAIRTALNATVEHINTPEVSLYYNRLHGLARANVPPEQQAVLGNAFVVRRLFGDSLQGEVTVRKLQDAVAELTNAGLLTESALPDELEDEEAAPATAKKGQFRAPTLTQLKEFYRWLQAKHYHIAFKAALTSLFRTLSKDRSFISKMTEDGCNLISFFDNDVLIELICNGNGQNVTIGEVLDQGQVLYLNLNDFRASRRAHLIGTLILEAIAQCAGKRLEQLKKRRNPSEESKLAMADVYIDEAHNLASETMHTLLSQGRAAKFHITLLTQGVDDFYRNDSKASYQQIIGNCNLHIALRSLDAVTADEFARASGAIDQIERCSTLGGFESAAGTEMTSGRTVSTQTIQLCESRQIMLLPDFEFMAKFPDGHIYKGLIPRLEPSSLPRCVTNLNQHQALPDAEPQAQPITEPDVLPESKPNTVAPALPLEAQRQAVRRSAQELVPPPKPEPSVPRRIFLPVLGLFIISWLWTGLVGADHDCLMKPLIELSYYMWDFDDALPVLEVKKLMTTENAVIQIALSAVFGLGLGGLMGYRRGLLSQWHHTTMTAIETFMSSRGMRKALFIVAAIAFILGGIANMLLMVCCPCIALGCAAIAYSVAFRFAASSRY